MERQCLENRGKSRAKQKGGVNRVARHRRHHTYTGGQVRDLIPEEIQLNGDNRIKKAGKRSSKSRKARKTHSRGGSITYSKIGGGQYEVRDNRNSRQTGKQPKSQKKVYRANRSKRRPQVINTRDMTLQERVKSMRVVPKHPGMIYQNIRKKIGGRSKSKKKRNLKKKSGPLIVHTQNRIAEMPGVWDMMGEEPTRTKKKKSQNQIRSREKIKIKAKGRPIQFHHVNAERRDEVEGQWVHPHIEEADLRYIKTNRPRIKLEFGTQMPSNEHPEQNGLNEGMGFSQDKFDYIAGNEKVCEPEVAPMRVRNCKKKKKTRTKSRGKSRHLISAKESPNKKRKKSRNRYSNVKKVEIALRENKLPKNLVGARRKSRDKQQINKNANIIKTRQVKKKSVIVKKGARSKQRNGIEKPQIIKNEKKSRRVKRGSQIVYSMRNPTGADTKVTKMVEKREPKREDDAEVIGQRKASRNRTRSGKKYVSVKKKIQGRVRSRAKQGSDLSRTQKNYLSTFEVYNQENMIGNAERIKKKKIKNTFEVMNGLSQRVEFKEDRKIHLYGINEDSQNYGQKEKTEIFEDKERGTDSTVKNKNKTRMLTHETTNFQSGEIEIPENRVKGGRFQNMKLAEAYQKSQAVPWDCENQNLGSMGSKLSDQIDIYCKNAAQKDYASIDREIMNNQIGHIYKERKTREHLVLSKNLYKDPHSETEPDRRVIKDSPMARQAQNRLRVIMIDSLEQSVEEKTNTVGTSGSQIKFRQPGGKLLKKEVLEEIERKLRKRGRKCKGRADKGERNSIPESLDKYLRVWRDRKRSQVTGSSSIMSNQHISITKREPKQAIIVTQSGRKSSGISKRITRTLAQETESESEIILSKNLYMPQLQQESFSEIDKNLYNNQNTKSESEQRAYQKPKKIRKDLSKIFYKQISKIQNDSWKIGTLTRKELRRRCEQIEVLRDSEAVSQGAGDKEQLKELQIYFGGSLMEKIWNALGRVKTNRAFAFTVLAERGRNARINAREKAKISSRDNVSELSKQSVRSNFKSNNLLKSHIKVSGTELKQLEKKKEPKLRKNIIQKKQNIEKLKQFKKSLKSDQKKESNGKEEEGRIPIPWKNDRVKEAMVPKVEKVTWEEVFGVLEGVSDLKNLEAVKNALRKKVGKMKITPGKNKMHVNKNVKLSKRTQVDLPSVSKRTQKSSKSPISPRKILFSKNEEQIAPKDVEKKSEYLTKREEHQKEIQKILGGKEISPRELKKTSSKKKNQWISAERNQIDFKTENQELIDNKISKNSKKGFVMDRIDLKNNDIRKKEIQFSKKMRTDTDENRQLKSNGVATRINNLNVVTGISKNNLELTSRIIESKLSWGMEPFITSMASLKGQMETIQGSHARQKGTKFGKVTEEPEIRNELQLRNSKDQKREYSMTFNPSVAREQSDLGRNLSPENPTKIPLSKAMANQLKIIQSGSPIKRFSSQQSKKGVSSPKNRFESMSQKRASQMNLLNPNKIQVMSPLAHDPIYNSQNQNHFEKLRNITHSAQMFINNRSMTGMDRMKLSEEKGIFQKKRSNSKLSEKGAKGVAQLIEEKYELIAGKQDSVESRFENQDSVKADENEVHQISKHFESGKNVAKDLKILEKQPVFITHRNKSKSSHMLHSPNALLNKEHPQAHPSTPKSIYRSRPQNLSFVSENNSYRLKHKQEKFPRMLRRVCPDSQTDSFFTCLQSNQNKSLLHKSYLNHRDIYSKKQSLKTKMRTENNLEQTRRTGPFEKRLESMAARAGSDSNQSMKQEGGRKKKSNVYIQLKKIGLGNVTERGMLVNSWVECQRQVNSSEKKNEQKYDLQMIEVQKNMKKSESIEVSKRIEDLETTEANDVLELKFTNLSGTKQSFQGSEKKGMKRSKGSSRLDIKNTQMSQIEFDQLDSYREDSNQNFQSAQKGVNKVHKNETECSRPSEERLEISPNTKIIITNTKLIENKTDPTNYLKKEPFSRFKESQNENMNQSISDLRNSNNQISYQHEPLESQINYSETQEVLESIQKELVEEICLENLSDFNSGSDSNPMNRSEQEIEKNLSSIQEIQREGSEGLPSSFQTRGDLATGKPNLANGRFPEKKTGALIQNRVEIGNILDSKNSNLAIIDQGIENLNEKTMDEKIKKFEEITKSAIKKIMAKGNWGENKILRKTASLMTFKRPLKERNKLSKSEEHFLMPRALKFHKIRQEMIKVGTSTDLDCKTNKSKICNTNLESDIKTIEKETFSKLDQMVKSQDFNNFVFQKEKNQILTAGLDMNAKNQETKVALDDKKSRIGWMFDPENDAVDSISQLLLNQILTGIMLEPSWQKLILQNMFFQNDAKNHLFESRKPLNAGLTTFEQQHFDNIIKPPKTDSPESLIIEMSHQNHTPSKISPKINKNILSNEKETPNWTDDLEQEQELWDDSISDEDPFEFEMNKELEGFEITSSQTESMDWAETTQQFVKPLKNHKMAGTRAPNKFNPNGSESGNIDLEDFRERSFNIEDENGGTQSFPKNLKNNKKFGQIGDKVSLRKVNEIVSHEHDSQSDLFDNPTGSLGDQELKTETDLIGVSSNSLKANHHKFEKRIEAEKSPSKNGNENNKQSKPQIKISSTDALCETELKNRVPPKTQDQIPWTTRIPGRRKHDEPSDSVYGIRTNRNAVLEYCHLLIQNLKENHMQFLIRKFTSIRLFKEIGSVFGMQINPEQQIKHRNYDPQGKRHLKSGQSPISKEQQPKTARLLNILEGSQTNNKSSMNTQLNSQSLLKQQKIKLRLENEKECWARRSDKELILSEKIYLQLEQQILSSYENMNINATLFSMQKIYHRCVFDAFNETLTNYICQKVCFFGVSPEDKKIWETTVFEAMDVDYVLFRTEELIEMVTRNQCGLIPQKEDSLLETFVTNLDYDRFKQSLNCIRKEKLKRMCEGDLKREKDKWYGWVECKQEIIEDLSDRVMDVLIEDCVLFLVSQQDS